MVPAGRLADLLHELLDAGPVLVQEERRRTRRDPAPRRRRPRSASRIGLDARGSPSPLARRRGVRLPRGPLGALLSQLRGALAGGLPRLLDLHAARIRRHGLRRRHGTARTGRLGARRWLREERRGLRQDAEPDENQDRDRGREKVRSSLHAQRLSEGTSRS